MRIGDLDYKYLTKEQLLKVLESVPNGSYISPNTVGNMLVETGEGAYLGFIDFLFEGTYETGK